MCSFGGTLAAFGDRGLPNCGRGKLYENSEADLAVYLVDGQILPHPWTGSSDTFIESLHRTARVIRAAKPPTAEAPEVLSHY